LLFIENELQKKQKRNKIRYRITNIEIIE